MGHQNVTINKNTKERLGTVSSKDINIERARPAHCNCESHQRRYHDLLKYDVSLFTTKKHCKFSEVTGTSTQIVRY